MYLRSAFNVRGVRIRLFTDLFTSFHQICLPFAMYSLLKPLIFRTDPERAHYATMRLLTFAVRVPGVASLLKGWFSVRNPSLEREVCGLHFPNPVGLAAGFDKDARWLRELSVLGFGFVEIGTLTPVGQPGNDKPRLFRLPADRAILNRMGFNNGGVEAAVERLRRRPSGLIVGGNIGKNKVTPNDEAVNDYLACFDALHPHVDYFTVNVSSPNTPGLRELQGREPLERLLGAVVERNRATGTPRPIFLKIAPDMSEAALRDVIAVVSSTGIDGVIATNTTISRDDLTTPEVDALGPGGISGVPVRDRSTEVIRFLHRESGGSFPIIGVGGIDSPEAAQEKLDAGAVLVQVYSGLVFEGPGLVRRINRGLR